MSLTKEFLKSFREGRCRCKHYGDVCDYCLEKEDEYYNPQNEDVEGF